MKIDEPKSDGDGYLTEEYLECVRGYDFSAVTAGRYMVEVLAAGTPQRLGLARR